MEKHLQEASYMSAGRDAKRTLKAIFHTVIHHEKSIALWVCCVRLGKYIPQLGPWKVKHRRLRLDGF